MNEELPDTAWTDEEMDAMDQSDQCHQCGGYGFTPERCYVCNGTGTVKHKPLSEADRRDWEEFDRADKKRKER